MTSVGIWTFITWLRWYLPGFSTVKFFLSLTLFFKSKRQSIAYSQGRGGIKLYPIEGGSCSYLPMDLLWCFITLTLLFNEVYWCCFLCNVGCSFHSISMILVGDLRDVCDSLTARAFQLTSLIPDSPSLQSFPYRSADVIFPVFHFLYLIFS